MLNGTDMGVMVFDILRNDFHQPIVDGKCNRDSIEEQITIGAYSGQLAPLSQSDVNMICDLVDDLIKEYRNVE